MLGNDLKKINIVGFGETGSFQPQFIKPKKVFYRTDDMVETDVDKEWEMVERPDSVHCLVFDEDRAEFVLVRQVRIPVLANDEASEGLCTELCAGLMDDPELSPEATMVKELKEELGIEVLESDLMLIKTFKSAVGSTGNNAHYYAIVINEGTDRVEPEFTQDEFIVERRISIHDVNEFLSSDENMDTGTALTVLGFYLNIINMQDQQMSQMSQMQQQTAEEAVQRAVQEHNAENPGNQIPLSQCQVQEPVEPVESVEPKE